MANEIFQIKEEIKRLFLQVIPADSEYYAAVISNHNKWLSFELSENEIQMFKKFANSQKLTRNEMSAMVETINLINVRSLNEHHPYIFRDEQHNVWVFIYRDNKKFRVYSPYPLNEPTPTMNPKDLDAIDDHYGIREDRKPSHDLSFEPCFKPKCECELCRFAFTIGYALCTVLGKEVDDFDHLFTPQDHQQQQQQQDHHNGTNALRAIISEIILGAKMPCKESGNRWSKLICP